ncbi:MAG TPA: hypothetical protein VFA12_12615 [Stellaceae bacterium]|nr:hypothetical protein [Stellaceae bacterium]
MDKANEKPSDVDRLFSWLKTQNLRYREFAGARELSDAVKTWPALHQAAAESGRASEAPAPAGAEAARHRIEEEAKPMPAVAAEAIKAEPPITVPPEPSAGAKLFTALGRRMHSDRAEATEVQPPPAAAPTLADAAAQERAREAAERLRERLDAAMAVNPRPGSASEPTAGRSPAGQRAERGQSGRFFGGAYEPRDQAGARRGHSLEAVFSRLSGGRSRPLPDPRERSRAAPGLGSVFDRLR